MKNRLSLFALILLVAVFALASIAAAVTTNPPTGAPGYVPMVIPIHGVYSASRPAIVSFKAPAGFTVIHASASARSASGTSPTLKIRGKNGALVNYSGSVNTDTTVKDLVTSPGASFSDEGLQSIDMVIGGSSPKWSDVTLFLFLKRK